MCKAMEDWKKEIVEETAARVEAETTAKVQIKIVTNYQVSHQSFPGTGRLTYFLH